MAINSLLVISTGSSNNRAASASKEFDIRINNNSRASNGKGYRAITYTAFLFGLLQYCLSEERNYPYFLILDSPLTTFKELDSASPDESVGEGVERAFYQNLAGQTGQYQILILENKEPDQDLTGKMNYVHFSGESGEGRQGFFKTSEN